MKKVFITGITGFAGSHLAEYLVTQKEMTIAGTYISEEQLKNLDTIKNHVELFSVDLLEKEHIAQVLATYKPDVVYHLAALTSVAKSFQNPAETLTHNATAQINLLEGLRENNLLQTQVLIISSCNIYGLVKKEDLPISEDVPYRPDNPYAVSKITQDYIGLQYFLAYKMPIIRMRPFNHIGPRLSPDISIARFARQIALIEKGKQEPTIHVGNLETRRDFTDVRDIIKGYVLAIEKGQVGDVYNIGSGVSYGIGETLDGLLALSKANITVKEDESLFRPSDIPELLCDASKFKNQTGWKPEISIEQTLRDTLEYWRSIV